MSINDTKVCRLCLNLILDDMYENLEDMQKGMLAVIIPEFNFDLVCCPNIICYKCSKLLLTSYEFKSACMENNWWQNCDNTKEAQVSNNCCLCLGEISNKFDNKDNILLNMKLRKCLPELEVCLTHKVCESCNPLLETLFTFMTGCLYAETKIMSCISQNNGDKIGAINLYEIHRHNTSLRFESNSLNGQILNDYVNCNKLNSEHNDKDLEVNVTAGMEFDITVENFGNDKRATDNIKGCEAPIVESEMEEINCDQPVTANEVNISNRSKEKSYSRSKKTRPLYECKQCDFKSQYKFSIRRHSFGHKNIPVQLCRCQFCPFTTRHRQALTDHVAIHVRSIQTKSSQREKRDSMSADLLEYVCEECPFTTKYKENLGLHTLTHKYESQEMPFLMCSQCNFQTKYLRCLKSHLRRAHNR